MLHESSTRKWYFHFIIASLYQAKLLNYDLQLALLSKINDPFNASAIEHLTAAAGALKNDTNTMAILLCDQWKHSGKNSIQSVI